MDYVQKTERDILHESPVFEEASCSRKQAARIKADLTVLKKSDAGDWSKFLETPTGKAWITRNLPRMPKHFERNLFDDMFSDDAYFRGAYEAYNSTFASKGWCTYCGKKNVAIHNGACQPCATTVMYLTHIVNLIHNASIGCTGYESTTEQVQDLSNEIQHYWSLILRPPAGGRRRMTKRQREEEEEEESDDDDDLSVIDLDPLTETENIYFTAAGEAQRLGMEEFIESGTYYAPMSEEVFANLKNLGYQGASTENFDAAKELYELFLKGEAEIKSNDVTVQDTCALCGRERECGAVVVSHGKEIASLGTHCGRVLEGAEEFALLFRHIVSKDKWSTSYRLDQTAGMQAALKATTQANRDKADAYKKGMKKSGGQPVRKLTSPPKPAAKKPKTFLDELREQQKTVAKPDAVEWAKINEPDFTKLITHVLKSAFRINSRTVQMYMDPYSDIGIDYGKMQVRDDTAAWWDGIMSDCPADQEPFKCVEFRRHIKDQLKALFAAKAADPYYADYTFKKVRGWVWEISTKRMKEFYPYLLEHQLDYLFFPKTQIGKILTDDKLGTPAKIERLEDIVLNSDDCTRDFNSIFRRCENPEIAHYFAKTYVNDFKLFINNMTPLELMQYPYFTPHERVHAFTLRKLTSGVLADILSTALAVRDDDVIEFALAQPRCRPNAATLGCYLEKSRKPRATILGLLLAHPTVSPAPFFDLFRVNEHPDLLRVALLNPLASEKDLAFVARELFVDRQVAAIKQWNLPAKAIDLIVRRYLYNTV